MLISKNNARIRGNVLFIILIAVTLFAALTAAITQSNRGSTSMDKERGMLSASDILSYAGSMEKTVARMLSDGTISESALSFENDIWKLNNGNPAVPPNPNCTSDTCKIFHPAGGGLTPQTFNSQALPNPEGTEVKSGHMGVWSIQIDELGTSERDLVLVVSAIDLGTCRQINDLLRIPNPTNSAPSDNWSGAQRYDGTFTGPGDTSGTIGNLATVLQGKPAGCVHRTGGAYGDKDNYFYQVLLAR